MEIINAIINLIIGCYILFVIPGKLKKLDDGQTNLAKWCDNIYKKLK